MKDDVKPPTLTGDLHNLPAALAPLIAQPRWVLWQWERAKTKWTKVPYQSSGAKAKNNDQATWNSYAAVLKAVARWDGIGYCLLGGDIAAFDIDNCRDPGSGVIDPWATALVERAGTYAEITVSGTGLRVIGRGIGPALQRKFPVSGNVSCEVYRNCARYIVVTGNPLPSASQSLANIDKLIDGVADELGANRKAKKETNKPGSPEDGGHHAGQQDDEDLLWQIINTDWPVSQRSEKVWQVIHEMFRRGYRPEAVLNMILDRNYKISAHNYDQPKPREYAAKQVTNARRQLGLSVNDNGVVLKTQANICIALLKMGVTVRYDSFADRILIEGLSDFGPTLEDAAVNRLWLVLGRQYRLRPSKDMLRTVITDIARLNGFHPVRDYLDGLRWDGKPRIDTWLIDYGGAEDTEYTRAVGALMLVAAARRVRSPGCKFDEMVVIENPQQGTEKSTMLAALAGREDWFSDDLPLNVTGKEVIERLRGRWIIEAAELSGMRRADIEHLKAFLSRQRDRARMAYDRLVSEVPRQCIIVGTTNAVEYLKDTSGNRRFWPVRCKRFDIRGLRRDRDQLWAEAAAREAADTAIRLDPKLWPKAAEEQEQRLTRDPWFDALQAALVEMEGKIASASIWEILDVHGGQRTQEQNKRVNDAMRQLGWQRNKARTIKVGGKDVPGWTRGKQPWRLIIVGRDYGQLFVHYEREPDRNLFTPNDDVM